ncbi:MAG: hypothetical protein H6577_17130 [Lewinellaceae bacterium]|nr:hypothetical protein [Saprospiraceae bacterium]MCB9339851.1 hypothetical protein [Lewinellaceae bacterium]
MKIHLTFMAILTAAWLLNSSKKDENLEVETLETATRTNRATIPGSSPGLTNLREAFTSSRQMTG